MQADLNPTEPLGKIGLIIFVFGAIFSDLVEFGPATQVVLNLVLILVGILTGIHYVIKIGKEIGIIEPKVKDDATK